jgi:hypothetical protein
MGLPPYIFCPITYSGAIAIYKGDKSWPKESY